MRVQTHPGIDLDAAASIFVLEVQRNQRASIVFSVNPVQGATPLDVAYGLKGEKSCLASLPGARAILGDAFVDYVDGYEDGQIDNGFEAGTLFSALRRSVLESGATGTVADQAIFDAFRPFLRGLYIKNKGKLRALKNLPNVPMRYAGGYLWSLPCDFTVDTDLLVSVGVAGKLFHSRAGIGLTVFKGVDPRPDLGLLKENLSGEHWYCDPRGFLLTWGSKKFPREDSPPEGDPRSLDEMLGFIHRTF